MILTLIASPRSLHLCLASLGLLMAATWLGEARANDVDAGDEARERLVRAHTTFLADDLLEGRATGARGHELAMAYVVAQFQRLGLEPGANEGYRQSLALRQSLLNRDAGRLTIHPSGPDVTLVNITETIVRPGAAFASADLRAPAVFVGFGISAPEFDYDDFGTGIDVRGKIAVVLTGSPTRLPATARAHYSRQKTAELVRRGAIGIITLETPAEERRTPWAIVASRDRFPSMRLVEPDGTLFEAFPEIRAGAAVSRAGAGAFFTPSSRDVAMIFAAAERGEPQAFPLGIEVTLVGQAALSDVASANVLGWLAGTNPALAGEPLVITGHLDHLGMGAAVEGDTIYNGALDNALGIAVLLSVAESLAGGPPLERPVLFAALTGEEKGLLGAYALSRQPPARVQRFAANLNLDMPVILAPVRDVTGLGADHSSLGPVLAGAAGRQGFTVSPDPQPDEVIFVRSDQYAFIRRGVPALFLKSGLTGTPEGPDLAALEADFRKHRYHRPGDDLAQPIHWPSAAAFARLAADLAQAIANDPTAPRWNENDFFGTRFAPDRTGAPAKP